jgi:hypothetical protein
MKMAVRSVHLIRKSVDTVQKTSVGTAFDTAKKATLVLKQAPNFPFQYHLEGIFIRVSSISTATKLSIALSLDSGGDEMIVTSTESTITTGVTTAAKGATVYKIDLDYVFDSGTVFLFAKTDAGTVSIDAVELTYHE